MTIVNGDGQDDRESEGPPALQGQVGRPRSRVIDGTPVAGVALALLLLVVVALTLVTLPSSTLPAANRHRPVPATVTPPATSAPRPPTNMQLTSTTAGAALLSWRMPRPRPGGYRIYRAAGHYETPAIIAVIKNPTITHFTDTDLAPGTVYEYTLTAYMLTASSGLNESAPTAPVVAAVLAEPPTPPTAPLPTPLWWPKSRPRQG